MQFKLNTKRIFTTALAVIMLMSLLPVESYALTADAPAVTVTVSFSNGELIQPRTEIEVPQGLAGEYGYAAAEKDAPTAFDALVAVHRVLLGDDFNLDTAKSFLDIKDGFVKPVLADERGFGFTVNGRMPNDGVFNEAYGQYNAYMVDQAVLEDGDLVDFFFYQDPMYGDYYSWFDKQALTARVGAEVSLSLSGYPVCWFGAAKEETIESMTERLGDVGIYTGTDPNQLTDTQKKTDNNGNVTLTFDTPGTYYVSAVGDGKTPLVAPWCEVVVLPGQNQQVEELLTNISETFQEETRDWYVLDMAAYGLRDSLSKLDEYKLQAAADAAKETASVTDLARIAISLTAVGVDVTSLQTSEGAAFNLIAKIAETDPEKLSFVTDSVFPLLAYQSGAYPVKSGLTRDVLVAKILSARTSDRIWGYTFGGVDYADVDSTGMALSALAPIYLASSASKAGVSAQQYQAVKTAVDEALAKLSELQTADGSWGNSSTNAMVVIGLSALGISASEDSRFVKENGSALDGLLQYALADNSGFGLADNSEINLFSNEQAFRALVAYQGMTKANAAFNVYILLDDSSSKPGPSDDRITVQFILMGDKAHGSSAHSGKYPTWISKTEVTVEDGTTVRDVIVKILTEKGYTCVGAEEGYISAITNPDGVTLAEKTNGKNSGWLYRINGKDAGVGIKDYTVKAGDVVYLYYTDDYTKEYDPDGPKKSSGSSSGGGTNNRLPVTAPEASSSPSPSPTGTAGMFKDVAQEHWAYPYIVQLADKAIINGYEDDTYQPEALITRAEFAAILSRCSGEEITDTKSGFDDVSEEEWYAAPIAWSVRVGITSGIGDNLFAPEEAISRQDIAVMLTRYLAYQGKTLTAEKEAFEFADSAEISDYAKEAVTAMQRAGILSGNEFGAFEPHQSATRAETAKMVQLTLFE